MNKIKAYKVFNPNWTCLNFKYEVGKTYEIKEPVNLCKIGFHACTKINNCFNYYSFNTKNKVAEVELFGDVLGIDEEKQCSSKIKIIKEITWENMLKLANIGVGNSGHSNSGNRNSGDMNGGDMNSGNRNSGDMNGGNSNSGNRNSGHWNSGDWNGGNCNSGNKNSGNWNSGHWNSGNRNSGNCNSGNSNSGNKNSGDWNSGNRNSGYWNSGDWNGGNCNSGNKNSGDWNSGNRNSGYFNNIIPKIINVFNNSCDINIWDNIEKPKFIYNIILEEWVYFNNMSVEEKKLYPKAYIRDGYLKTHSYKDAWNTAYKNATTDDIILLKQLPNFDVRVFEDITGIRIK